MEYAVHTHVGERDNNEDSIKVIHKEDVGYCFVVADGLGGHSRGEDASRYTVEVFEEEFMKLGITTESDDKQLQENFLEKSFEKSQEKLEMEQDKTGGINELKTTAVALTVIEDVIKWAHIGDSRLYMFNNNKIVVRTLDHSVPQMLVFAGELKEKNIRNHPDRNRLLRVLGARNVEVKVDYSEEYTIDDCQSFLLCSDGFWECITERKMCKFLKKSKSVKEWLDMMVAEVEKNGKGTNMDNNSAIAVWVKDKRSGFLWM